MPLNAPKKSRRWFLKFILGAGGVAAAGKIADYLLPLTICRPGEWHGPVSDHFDGTFFFNDEQLPTEQGPHASDKWEFLVGDKGEYPQVQRNRRQPQLAPLVSGQEWEVTMVNHSTMLIRAGGLNILTDPIWSDYASPIQGVGPCRTRPPGIAWDALPPINACLLSHDHYDHFDAATLKRLYERDNPLFIVPLGLRSLLKFHTEGDPRIEEKDWWESVAVSRKMEVTLTPARHWSRRYRTRETANRSLWCGFMIKAMGGPSIYYAGDTARTRWFKEIYRRLGAPELALLPIGAYKPEWIRNNHTSPADAVQAFLDLHASRAIACHFGTWQLAHEGYQETLDGLSAALAAAGIEPARFIAPENGQTIRKGS